MHRETTERLGQLGEELDVSPGRHKGAEREESAVVSVQGVGRSPAPGSSKAADAVIGTRSCHETGALAGGNQQMSLKVFSSSLH